MWMECSLPLDHMLLHLLPLPLALLRELSPSSHAGLQRRRSGRPAGAFSSSGSSRSADVAVDC
jgi:hypothetical protein